MKKNLMVKKELVATSGEKINLEYYLLEKDNKKSNQADENFYGIEIVKSGSENEKNEVKNLSNTKNEVLNVINLLYENDVTPMSLFEVLDNIYGE